MFIELDSTDIIAFLIKENGFDDDFIIPFSRICHIAEVIESENKDILTFCDRVSIDAFRCAFSDNVKIEHSNITIYNIGAIRSNVERLLPPQRIIELLAEIEER